MLDLFLPSSSPNSRRKRRLTSSPTQCYIQQDMPPPLPAEQSRTPHTADRRALRMQQHLTGGHHSPLSFHPSISLLFLFLFLFSLFPLHLISASNHQLMTLPTFTMEEKRRASSSSVGIQFGIPVFIVAGCYTCFVCNTLGLKWSIM